jgi:hypothetical protein
LLLFLQKKKSLAFAEKSTFFLKKRSKRLLFSRAGSKMLTWPATAALPLAAADERHAHQHRPHNDRRLT